EARKPQPKIAEGVGQLSDDIGSGRTVCVQVIVVARCQVDQEENISSNGRVFDADGDTLPDVVITIQHHPEWGRGRTLANGVFSMGVNGGKPLTVNYERPGYLSVQRTITPDVQRYTWLPDVTMLERDAPAN